MNRSIDSLSMRRTPRSASLCDFTHTSCLEGRPPPGAETPAVLMRRKGPRDWQIVCFSRFEAQAVDDRNVVLRKAAPACLGQEAERCERPCGLDNRIYRVLRPAPSI